jgi:hypothetical protein
MIAMTSLPELDPMDHGEFEGWARESFVLARDVDLRGCSRGL